MEASITCRKKDGTTVTYVKPPHCPIPAHVWRDPMGYCWGLALMTDEGKREQFVKENCENPVPTCFEL